MIKHLGFRGYLSSRPTPAGRVPQHVQNLVIRDYCNTNNLRFLLSAVEYAMPNCYIMLEQVLKEAVNNHGLVMYSLFQLPQNAEGRQRIYDTLLENEIELHMAVEGLVVNDKQSVQRVEDIWLVHQVLYGDNTHSMKNQNPGRRNPMNFFGFGNYGRN
jgi:sporadic carbohydrate cluster protein (TIGR04323 family)